MPVISPRRSSTSGSGSVYGTSSSGTGSTSTSTAGAYSSASSYLNRANSLSKTTTPSSSLWSPSSSTGTSKYSPNYYSSYLGGSTSSYSPRTASQRNSLSSLYLSGGSSGLGTYRSSSSYLSPASSSSNDTITTSRYGLPKSPKTSTDTLRKRKDRDTNKESNDLNGGDAKKPPSGSETGNKRLSGSYSSSSLARLVATSGLEIYEKYSPANYKPNTELSRSSSALTEAEVAAATGTSSSLTNTGAAYDDTRNETVTNITLDRPRSRYSHLYSTGDEAKSTNSISSLSNNNYSTKTENDSTSTTTKPHRSSYRERAAAAAAKQNSANALASSASSSSVLSHSSSSGDVPTATFTLRSNRTIAPKTTVTKAEELSNGDRRSKADSVGDSISRQGSRTNLHNSGNSTNDLETNLKELKLSTSHSGSGLYKDSSSGSITTVTVPLHSKRTTISASNSSGHLSALTTSNDSNNSNDNELKRNHSANNLDVVDNCATTTHTTNTTKSSYEFKTPQTNSSAAAGGAEVCASTTLQMPDSPITAKKVKIACDKMQYASKWGRNWSPLHCAVASQFIFCV